MSDNITPIRRKIIIDHTKGGGKQLQQCYFLPTDLDGAYNLYNSQNELVAAYVVSGEDFNLTVDDVHFVISKFKIDNRRATGKWEIPGVPIEEPEGTFQASSSGGVAGDDEVETVVSDAPANAIEIDTVTGGADKDKLKKLYFLPDGSEYVLYSKDGNELASGLTSGNGFNFQHDSIQWTVTNFVISSTAASGNWSNPDSITAEQDGTFQASSSGGAGEEEAASAASA